MDRTNAKWIRSLFREEIGDESYRQFVAEEDDADSPDAT